MVSIATMSADSFRIAFYSLGMMNIFYSLRNKEAISQLSQYYRGMIPWKLPFLLIILCFWNTSYTYMYKHTHTHTHTHTHRERGREREREINSKDDSGSLIRKKNFISPKKWIIDLSIFPNNCDTPAIIPQYFFKSVWIPASYICFAFI
jgi:hypothetical protein